jgi:hypothetical protein
MTRLEQLLREVDLDGLLKTPLDAEGQRFMHLPGGLVGIATTPRGDSAAILVSGRELVEEITSAVDAVVGLRRLHEMSSRPCAACGGDGVVFYRTAMRIVPCDRCAGPLPGPDPRD